MKYHHAGTFLKTHSLGMNVCLLLIFVLVGGFLSIHFGFDNDWDTRNYHLYNPYAFLNGRVGYDIMPASIMTYYNPVLDLFYYFMVMYLNDFPRLVAFIFGISYGLLTFMTLKISQIVFKKHRYSFALSLLSTLVGCTALYTVFTIGRQSQDVFVGFLVLLSVYLILCHFEKNKNIIFIIFSGALFGCIGGFKYIYAPIGVAAFIALFFSRKLFYHPYKTLFIFALSGIVGFLATNGWWMWYLYKNFNNPIFPQFSEFFPNQWINPLVRVQQADANTFHYVAWYNVWMIPFKKSCDYRFMSIWLIFILNLFVWRKISPKTMIQRYGMNLNYSNFLLLFSFLSIIFLIKFFVELRYSCATAALSGIIVIVYLTKFLACFLKNFPVILQMILLLLFSSFLILSSDFSRIHQIRRHPIGNQVLFVQDISLEDDAVVLVEAGAGFVVPYQNPKARYLYFPEMRFLKNKIQILSDVGYTKLRQILRDQDNIYFLTSPPLHEKMIRNKERMRKKLLLKELEHNYALTIDKCVLVKSNAHDCALCRLRQITGDKE